MSENENEPEELRAKARSNVKVGDFERPGLDHTLYAAPDRPPDTIGRDPEDGLPKQIPTSSIEDSSAPPLSPHTFVCMADTSLFVLRNQWGEVVGRFAPEHVQRTPDGSYRVSFWLALKARVPFVTAIRARKGPWCIVEALRPQCRHYRRQFKPWRDDPDRRQCIRYCTAIRDEHGEMISLNDDTLLACELREPRTAEATTLIDEFDEGLVELGKNAKESEQDDFDVEAELAKGAGIFEGN